MKKQVLPVVKKAAQATTKAVKNAVKPKNLLNTLQTGLDIVGMVPVVGEVADGVNGIIYAARGDKVNAALSFGAMIPVVGNAATAGKWVNKGAKAAKGISESAQKANKGLLGNVKEKVNKQVSNVKTQIQARVDEVKQQLRQLGAPQMELAGANVGRISDTGSVGKNTSSSSPKPSNSQPPQNGSNKKPAEVTKEKVGPSHEKVDYGDHFTKSGRKKVLKPNVEYKSPDGYTYRTDNNGRISECEGTLILGTAERNAYAQRTVGGKDRLPDDDGGHLIGAQFKGPKDIDNLVPQNSQINRSGGEWFNMETEWANALKETPPKKVTVQINPTYSGDSMRPDAFEVIYHIEGQRQVEKTIKNQAGG
ncbi:DNA/RNA non-specific endonuclease [Lysinibacillus sp. JK80]|uniref:DNA/RNA non-specific endonuclease n=1 Tax=Lysinibacillus sp. JK80 TaxID=2749809 RepID=UPI0022B9C38F|nr:DNA/RNA non-specific endonuclease [Lysinibacillus sp. JK80]